MKRIALHTLLFSVLAAVTVMLTERSCSAAEHPDLVACRRLMAAGKRTEAAEKLREFRRKEPDNHIAVFLLAEIEDDPARAAALYREVELLALMPGQSDPDTLTATEASLSRARLALELGDYEETLKRCDETDETFADGPWTPKIDTIRGRALLALGRSGAALESFSSGLERAEDDTTRLHAAAGIMECRVALGQWKEALDAARRVLNESDDESALTPRVLEVTARAWRELGNEENAKWYTDRLLSNYPDSYQAHTMRVQGAIVARDMGFTPGADGGGVVSPDRNGASTDAEPLAEGSGDNAAEADGDTEMSPSPPAGGFTVQASAFKNRMNALKMYNTLKNRGFDARIEMKTVRDMHLFLVRVGIFLTREEAEKVMERVSSATGEKAAVVMTGN